MPTCRRALRNGATGRAGPLQYTMGARLVEVVMNEQAAIETPKRSRTPYFILGVLLFVLGPVLYAIQFNMNRLTAPWYAPALASVGLLLLVISVARRPGIIRIVLTVLFALVCAFEWFMLLVATRTPTYAGPATVGARIPAF